MSLVMTKKPPRDASARTAGPTKQRLKSLNSWTQTAESSYSNPFVDQAQSTATDAGGLAVQKVCSECMEEETDEGKQIQRAQSKSASVGPERVRSLAAHGVAGSSSRLPYLDRIQPAFGSHDISRVQAFMGSRAAEASRAIGARAYTIGNRVAFDGPPSLEVAAHEAAHVVQQRRRLQLEGGIGNSGDIYERYADAVAARVVAGRSAEDLLNPGPSERYAAASTTDQAVQGWKLGDLTKFFRRRLNMVSDIVGDVVCTATPDTPRCINREVIKDLEDLELELDFTHYYDEVLPIRQHGDELVTSLLSEILLTVGKVMQFKDDEGVYSYRLFEIRNEKKLAANLLSAAIGLTPGCGPALSFAISSGTALIGGHEQNREIGRRISADKYLTATTAEMIALMSDVLHQENEIIRKISAPDSVLRNLHDQQRSGILDDIVVALDLATSSSDKRSVASTAAIAKRGTENYLLTYRKNMTDLTTTVQNLSEDVPRALEEMQEAVRKIKAKYITWVMGGQKVGFYGAVSRYSGEITSLQGKVFLAVKPKFGIKEALGDKLLQHLYSQTPRELSNDGAEIQLDLKVGPSKIIIDTSYGGLVWEASPQAMPGLEAMAESMFPDEEPSAQKLVQTIFSTIRNRRIGDLVIEGDGPRPGLGIEVPSEPDPRSFLEKVIGEEFHLPKSNEDNASKDDASKDDASKDDVSKDDASKDDEQIDSTSPTWRTKDIFRGVEWIVKKGTKKATDTAQQLLCLKDSAPPECDNLDSVKQLKDLAIELTFLDDSDDIERTHTEGAGLAESLLEGIIATAADIMAFRDAEGSFSYRRFEANCAKDFTINTANSALGFIKPLGTVLSFSLSAGLTIYEYYDADKNLGARISAHRYMSDARELLADVRKALEKDNAIIRAITAPYSILGNISKIQLPGVIKDVNQALALAKTSTDTRAVAAARKIATRRATELVLGYSEQRAALIRTVNHLRREVPEARDVLRVSVRKIKATYIANIMDHDAVRMRGALVKHNAKDSWFPEKHDDADYMGRIYISANIDDKDRKLISGPLLEYMFSRTPKQLSLEGANLRILAKVRTRGVTPNRVPGVPGSIEKKGNLTIGVADGRFWWSCDPKSEHALSGMAYRSFPGTHPDLAANLVQAIFDAIRHKPISAFITDDEDEGELRVPTPR